jgi:hypothetical protein
MLLLLMKEPVSSKLMTGNDGSRFYQNTVTSYKLKNAITKNSDSQCIPPVILLERVVPL